MDIFSLNLVNFDPEVRRCHEATYISLTLMHLSFNDVSFSARSHSTSDIRISHCSRGAGGAG